MLIEEMLIGAMLGVTARLTISEHTVKFHVASILGKFGAATRTEAVSLAAQKGLITLRS